MTGKHKKYLLVTGIPRSGTSLTTKLISEQPNTVCFSEPTWLKEIRFDGQTRTQFSGALMTKIQQIRAEIKKGNPVEITVKKGSNELPDNYFIKENNQQVNTKSTQSVYIEHSEELLICVKSNTLFTVCLEDLLSLEACNIMAVIRNPLYVLMSWRSLNIPISHGKIKIGELYSKRLQEIVIEPDLLKRQVLILGWFFQQYAESNLDLLSYESLVSNPEAALQSFLPNAIKLKNMAFESKNKPSCYMDKDTTKINEALKKAGGFFAEYYPGF